MCTDLRQYDTIEKTATAPFVLGPTGEGAAKMLDDLRGLHDLGVTVATGSLRGGNGPRTVAAYGEHIIPEISTW